SVLLAPRVGRALLCALAAREQQRHDHGQRALHRGLCATSARSESRSASTSPSGGASITGGPPRRSSARSPSVGPSNTTSGRGPESAASASSREAADGAR